MILELHGDSAVSAEGVGRHDHVSVYERAHHLLIDAKHVRNKFGS